MKGERIGIMGGTFDPVHIAHLVIAQEVLEKLKLRQVWFVPSFIPPHKKDNRVSKPQHRLKMLKLATENDKRFSISDVELKRKGISYTVDTLKELSLSNPGIKLYLILGVDNLKYLSTWKEPEEVYGLAQVVLVRRPGYRLPSGNRWVEKAVTIEAPLWEVSSSQIRERVKAGLSISYWVPEKVRKYIEKHKLYTG